MSLIRKFRTGFKAARHLGFKTVYLYGLYQIEIKSGWLKFKTNRDLRDVQNIPFSHFLKISHKKADFLLTLPDKKDLEKLPGFNIQSVISEADQICNGFYRQFGSDLVRINLNPDPTLQNWTSTRDDNETQDLKFIWEPARFGWTFTLGRAYLLTGDEKYPAAFWKFFNVFRNDNPPYKGANWVSGQEAGLRIMAFAFAWQVFSHAETSTNEHQANLLSSIAEHAARIPAGLIYARAQRNNHQLTEAAGLYTAGVILNEIKQAKKWKTLGWKWFNDGLIGQISDGGTYAQHSMNYHRLMLQTSLWVKSLADKQGQVFPSETLKKLASAARWLICQIDIHSGKTPNLGSNDGARILPLSSCEYEDFRTTAQSASAAFLNQKTFPAGLWDEMSLWLEEKKETTPSIEKNGPEIEVLKIGDQNAWATLRAAAFNERPSHADLLHVDLWFQGKNYALDAGTFRYTAPPPWDNSLAKTLVHNTISINGQDQMQKAGRFLWLDWAESKILVREKNRLVAEHYGYKKSGVIHRREILRKNASTWLITDFILPVISQNQKTQILLNWLVPDLPWKLTQHKLQIISSPYRVELLSEILSDPQFNQPESCLVTIVRAGTNLTDSKQEWPIHGWYSATYGKKEPALSYLLQVEGIPPLAIQSKWVFSSETAQHFR